MSRTQWVTHGPNHMWHKRFMVTNHSHIHVTNSMRRLHTTHSTTCHDKSDSYICHELNETPNPLICDADKLQSRVIHTFVMNSMGHLKPTNPRICGANNIPSHGYTNIDWFWLSGWQLFLRGQFVPEWPLLNFKLDWDRSIIDSKVPNNKTES